jgi:hypothetical protein
MMKTHDARSLVDYVKRADFEDAVKLVQMYGDLRVAEATPKIIVELFGQTVEEIMKVG